jgi:hypothetical protein
MSITFWPLKNMGFEVFQWTKCTLTASTLLEASCRNMEATMTNTIELGNMLL